MDKTRKKHLENLLFEQFDGKKGNLNELMGWSSGRVSQLLMPNLPFGERVAKRIVEKLGLPQDYFDRHIDEPAPGRPIGGLLGDGETSAGATMNLGLQAKKEYSMHATLLADFFEKLPDDTMVRSLAYSKAVQAIEPYIPDQKPSG